MDELQWQNDISAKVPQTQIIFGSLLSGCVIFLAIAAVIVFQGEQAGAAWPNPVLTYISLLLGAAAIVAAWFMPSIISARARRAILAGSWRPPQGPRVCASQTELLERCGDAGRLWLLYQTATIIRAAVLEGAAFFLLVVYIVERSPVSLAAALILILFLAALFPSRRRAVQWIDDQLDMLDQQRQFCD